MITKQKSVDKTMCDIRRRAHKQCSGVEKIRIILGGLRSENSVAQ